MTALAVLMTISSRVLIEDEDEEELLSAEEAVMLLLFRMALLAGRLRGEDCTLGVGEATPRATSWSGQCQYFSFWSSSKGPGLPQVRGK